MKLPHIALSLASILLASCSVFEEDALEQLDKSFDFALDATMADLIPADEDDATKGSVTTVVRLTWQAGDKVSAINLTTGKALGGDLVANESGTTTTFSGTLNGNVRQGDKIAFLYPSQGYTEEQTYQPVTVDFSNQTGHSNSGVPYSVYTVVTAGSNTFNRTSATFKFLMSYLQMNLTGLEANAGISSVSVDNIGSGVTLGITADGISATPVPGTITMTPPASYKVKADGTRTFYMSFAESPAVAKRTITAYTDNELKTCDWTGSKLNNSTSYTSTLASFVDGNIPFEDANFKAYCVSNFDTNRDGEISLAEARAVTSIDVDVDNITSVDEVRYFKNLESLSIHGSGGVWSEDGNNWNSALGINFASLPIMKGASSSGKVTSLNLSGLAKLTRLEISCTMLESVDISACTNLTTIYICYTRISDLDVSNNTALTSLYCYSNQLTSLDLSKNTALTYLKCFYNQLTSLDVCKNTALVELNCNSNQLTSLDVSQNTALTRLYCSSTQLTSLDVSKNIALKTLYCGGNQLTNLDLSNNTALTDLDCRLNQLTSLDVSNNTALTSLSCPSNQLTSLDVNNNTALAYLYCYSNQLTNLDVSKNTALTYLACSPMSTLAKLIMTAGQEIYHITVNRNTDCIPSTTIIEYIGDSDMDNGGGV